MGMYNEVYRNCPECNKQCRVQIGQIVLGFGGFNLSNPEELAGMLTGEEIETLREYLVDKTFYCRKDDNGCGAHFTACGEAHETRADRIRQLFRT